MSDTTTRAAMAARHPERELEVVWQRHIPAGFGAPIDGDLDENDARVDAVADLSTAVETALEQQSDHVLGRGDLVVTISVRPFPEVSR